jgi:hypothetical protein
MPRTESARNALDWRAVLWLCLPALIVGVALRVWLTRQVPLAYFNQDVLGFLETAIGLHTHSEFDLNRKRTVLVPVFYWLLSLTKLPLASIVPIIQHVLGCLIVAVFGFLGRVIFRSWKIFVILLTLLLAIDPNLLFYEHYLMAELPFLFCIVLMTVAGAWYAISRSIPSLLALLVFFFFTSIARPEGKLFVLFPLLLIVLSQWRNWRPLAMHAAALVAAFLLCASLKSGSEGGLLLYTWVVHLTPDKLTVAPDFPPVIANIRQAAVADWQRHDQRLYKMPVGWQFETRRKILKTVTAYLGATSLPEDDQFRVANKFCTKVAIETCLRRPFSAAFVMVKKGIGKIRELTGNEMENGLLRDKTADVLQRSPEAEILLTRTGLRGPDEAQAFVVAHYPEEVPWFNTLRKYWSNAINGISIPRDEWRFAGAKWPAIPVFYMLAIAGLITAISQKSALRSWHISLAICFGFVLSVVMLTANVRGRFRFFLESFWLLYFLVFADFIAAKIMSWRTSTTFSRTFASSE